METASIIKKAIRKIANARPEILHNGNIMWEEVHRLARRTDDKVLKLISDSQVVETWSTFPPKDGEVVDLLQRVLKELI